MRVEIAEAHGDEIRGALEAACGAALEEIGALAEGYAREAARFPGGTGRLSGSIVHAVEGDVVTVGSAVPYAPYVELGTGSLYEPPPEWLENNGARGRGDRPGVAARPFLRPAMEGHLEEYRGVIEGALTE